jgi:hypothetical protein
MIAEPLMLRAEIMEAAPRVEVTERIKIGVENQ